jgi:ribosomal protein S18 acetylase RimI-like enzyme
MEIKYRDGNINDLKGLKNLAVKSWGEFESKLTNVNWEKLSNTLNNDNTYLGLLDLSNCVVCTTESDEIIGMAFLVPSGNPTEIYDKDWCYLRFISVDPAFGGQGIGRKLTESCIQLAKDKGEKTVALHTSEIMEKARHIYESLGFKILKEIDQRFGKRYWLYILDIDKTYLPSARPTVTT